MIPEFGLGQVLPPFMGMDVVGEYLPRSPYSATMQEVVQRFATSNERCIILRGLIQFRAALREAGFRDGLQWIDGSFVENCEAVKGRPPGDVDVVSLLSRPTHLLEEDAWAQFIEQNAATLFNTEWTKENHHCDNYYVDLGIDPRSVAEQSAYWFGLFSHQRDTFRWKGLVQVELRCDDEAAAATLAALEQAW